MHLFSQLDYGRHGQARGYWAPQVRVLILAVCGMFAFPVLASTPKRKGCFVTAVRFGMFAARTGGCGW